ncbi:MAG: hypothetical protein ACLQVL_05995 [Terriglobia bacterium]
MNSDDQIWEVRMTFEDGSSERLLVTPLVPNLYRLEASSVLGEASYHDIVETDPQTDGTLRFVRVVTPSGLKTVSWILPKVQIESPALSPLLGRVITVGGFWERIFGGVLLVHLPPAELDNVIGQFKSFFSQPCGTASKS